ncbi:hypothetical protein D3C71_1938570 [compost metagenome]
MQQQDRAGEELHTQHEHSRRCKQACEGHAVNEAGEFGHAGVAPDVTVDAPAQQAGGKPEKGPGQDIDHHGLELVGRVQIEAQPES